MAIELKPNNLYINGIVVFFDSEDTTSDEQMLIRNILDIPSTIGDRVHTVTQYDRIDKLAYNYYKDKVSDPSKYWWVIADANDIQNPLDLTDYVGTDIVIPDILKVPLYVDQ